MRYGIGAAPEWFLKRLREFEPLIEAHAIKFARAYFDQFKKDEHQLIRGPDAPSSFAMFKREHQLPFWTEEEQPSVEWHLLAVYDGYQDHEYHRLLIHEMLGLSGSPASEA